MLEAVHVDAMVLMLQTVDVQELMESSRAFSVSPHLVQHWLKK